MLIRSYELLIEHRKKVIAIAVAIALTVVLLFLLSYENVRADSVMLYPKTCFGNWKNSDAAAGTPILTLDSPQEDFNESNSALLVDESQLTCTGFGGEIPDGTVPNKLKVSLVWSVDNGEVDHAIKEIPPVTIDTLLNEGEKGLPVIDPVTIESKEGEKKDETSDVVPVAETQQQTEESSVPIPEIETKSEPEAPSNSEPMTFLFTKKAFAQETDVSTAAASDSSGTSSAIDEVQSIDPIAPLVETTSKEPVSDNEGQNNFMEVLYSVNGDEWISLGMIKRSDWKSASFEIPISNWSDIDSMQLALKPLQLIDKQPVVYIDAMSFEISYDSFADLMKQNDNSSDQKKLIITKLLPVEGGMKITQRFDLDQGNILVFNSSQERTVTVANPSSLEQVTFFIGQDQTYELPSYQLSAGDWSIISLPIESSCGGLPYSDCVKNKDAKVEATFTAISAFGKPIVTETESGTAEVIPIQLTTPPLELDGSDISNNDVVELLNIQNSTQEQSKEEVPASATSEAVLPKEEVPLGITGEELLPKE